MKLRKNKFFSIVRIVGLFIIVLGVAVFVALKQVNLETLRGNVVAILRDTTGMPVEIDGGVSWRFSMRPHIELNDVRIENPELAKDKDFFSAKKIDVRINLVSLFRDRPTIQNIRVYDAVLNVEKDLNELKFAGNSNTPEGTVQDTVVQEKYPVRASGFGGVEIKNLVANVLGEKYSLSGLNVRMMPREDSREYSGWLKVEEDVFPFIVSMSEYNSERRVYPVRVAMSTGGDALIANFALEGKSKLPIDFIIKGDIPDVGVLGKIFGMDLSFVPAARVNLAGGLEHQKMTLRKSSINLRGTEFTVSGSYDWSKKIPVINVDVSSSYVNLMNVFPELYSQKRMQKNRELNVFQDVSLFGHEFRDRSADVRIRFGELVVYRDLNFEKLDLKLHVQDNRVRADLKTEFAGGNVNAAIDADVDADGVFVAKGAVSGASVSVGSVLEEIRKSDFVSDLPVDVQLYVTARGKNLSEIMQTITGPVTVYSVGPGYAHSALVSYVYGADFLTNLRHSIQDLFSSEKKYNQIKISCMALNAKLRDGMFETQNGVAIETNAINIRLAGALDLGQEEMKMSLTTVPVRGLKLSLTGNVVNSIELTGNLAQPNIKISGAAVAGKVASATGIGLLLAPFTGGIGLVAGTGIGLVAGDLLENWLADDRPCKTALERGAPMYQDDPEWFAEPVTDLMNSVLNNKG
ncbi:MAG: AsmA family protein [Alphaproteobacteria bacterium]|nr:AsmA family protein [Alphaproteobacteria bacterium]